MKVLSTIPLSWLRALGAWVGQILFRVVKKRRHVVMVNLELCYPELTLEQRTTLARKVFERFAQAWLDRSWIWHGSEALIRARLRWCGETQALEPAECHNTESHNKESHKLQETPLGTVIFAPHFWGLDAAWTLLTLDKRGEFSTIFTPQSSKASEAWMSRGRSRFGRVSLNTREDGVKKIIQSLRHGATLYLLPDMNFGPEESIFVDFYGIKAATVPSLSKFARVGQARVVPVTSSMTETGYDIRVHEAWENFPSADSEADTQAMNHWLEAQINLSPEQYLWVHKRFKTRPSGEAPFY